MTAFLGIGCRRRRGKDDLLQALVSARPGWWTVMVVDIDPGQVYRIDALARRLVREVALERLTRLHSCRRVFEVDESMFFVLVKWPTGADREGAPRDLAQRTSDALTANLSSGTPGLAAAIGHAEDTLPCGLLVPAADAARRAGLQQAYNCPLPFVRPNARIEQAPAGTTSTD